MSAYARRAIVERQLESQLRSVLSVIVLF